MIHKIAAIILKDKKFLAVKEYGLDTLLTPGGRVEEDESPEETLRRELKEEVNLDLISMRPFGIIKDKSIDRKEELTLETYFADVNGNLKPDSEIEEFFWVDSRFNDKKVKLSIPMQKHIIPKLLDMELIE
jgi:8-oxo-dGTP diphosphatase